MQVEKVLASPPFQHSDSNRRLLAFLAQKAETHLGQPVKEYELATSAFGLSLADFDPQVDSTVRVKVGRLRAKILEYYASYGVQDEIVLEVPKGAYCLLSRYKHSPSQTAPAAVEEAAAPAGAATAPVLVPSPAEERKTPLRMWPWGFMTVAAVCGLVLGGALVAGFWSHARGTQISPVLRRFWTSFYNQDKPVLAVFSNPRLAGVLSRGGLHYYSDSANHTDETEALNLGYAGAGDVRSIHALTQLFDQFHWNLGVESGALLSWDTAKDTNLIFIGRPEQNPALYELPLLREFYFKYNQGIINAHPAPGESASYHYSAPFEYDYAVIAFIPGIHPQENTLVLAGTTTWGSQAAVECVTQERCVASILDRLKVAPGQKVPHFEAVLKVKINNEIPVWSTVQAVHPYPTDYSSWVTPAPEDR